MRLSGQREFWKGPDRGTGKLAGTFDRERVAPLLASLASRGIFIGTSSWKYSGWRGQLYDTSRYVWRGRLSETRFERLCLAEYAEVFKTVCVDAAYYKFPDARFLETLAAQVLPGFRFAFKVTDEITVKRYPRLSRFGQRAGQLNSNYLNADLFQSAFLSSCETIKPWIGLLIFEFSRFDVAENTGGRDFTEALDDFLARLPQGWRYGVEIRNRECLHPDYFAVLARNGVAHVYNSWTDMPPLAEQFALPGSMTVPEFLGVRLLLKPERSYEQAVARFKPYDQIKDPYPEARAATAGLIKRALTRGRTQAFIYVNNRFEGNALETIAAILELTRGLAD